MKIWLILVAIPAVAITASASIAQEAAPQAWSTENRCVVSSPAVSGAPRLFLDSIQRTNEQGENNDTVQIRLLTKEALNQGQRTKFENASITISGYANWTGLTFTGRASGDDYLLSTNLPHAISAVLGPIEGGSTLTATLPTAEGPKVYDVSLKGSAKAVTTIRRCLDR